MARVFTRPRSIRRPFPSDTATRWATPASPSASRAPTPRATVCSQAGAMRVCTDVSSDKRSDRPGLAELLSTTPDPATASVSLASTDSDVLCANSSNSSPASRHAWFTSSTSRNASTPHRPPASSCSMCSAPSRTSSSGSSSSVPATASPQRGDAGARPAGLLRALLGDMAAPVHTTCKRPD